MHLRHGVHKSYKVKRIRDSTVNPCGTVVSKVQRLRSSAITLDSPGICKTSSSIPVLVAKVAKISTKKHKGLVVVNILLLTDSAPVLSLKDFRQIGILKPGKMMPRARPIQSGPEFQKLKYSFASLNRLEMEEIENPNV